MCMLRFAITTLVFLCMNATLADPSQQLTLPDVGNYSYWVQSRTGAVTSLPINISHQESLRVTVPFESGSRLVLLDAATGQWAEQEMAFGADGQLVPIAFSLGDFHPLTPPMVADAPPPPVIVADADPGISPLVPISAVLLLGLAVCGFVLYLRRHKGKAIFEPIAAVSGSHSDPKHASQANGKVNSRDEIIRQRSEIESDLQRGPEMPLAQPAALIGVQGLVTGSTFALTAGDVTIGRDGENEIVLAENTVSRYHARLLRQHNGQFALTDLGSANGVYVNGTRVHRAILQSGDQVKVGDNFFRFQTALEPHKEY